MTCTVACALDDSNPAECFTGPFKSSAVPFWDAGDQVPAPGSRKLETTMLLAPGSPSKAPFDAANMTAALLEATAADIPSYDYPDAVPADAEELADLITKSLEGCQFGTGTDVTVSILEREG